MSERNALGRWDIGFDRRWYVRAMFLVPAGALLLIGAGLVAAMIGGVRPFSLEIVPVVVVVAWLGFISWRLGQRGERWLVVARDGVRLTSMEDPDFGRLSCVTRFDPEAQSVLIERQGEQPRWQRLALDRLQRETMARVEAQIKAGLSASEREPLVSDELLRAETMSELQARLGVGGGMSEPFRARRAVIEVEKARLLLDDLGATRAELLASAIILAHLGVPQDRASIERVADGCAFAPLAELLRAVARREPCEGQYTDFRVGAGRFGRVLRRVGELVTPALGWSIAVDIAAPGNPSLLAYAGVLFATALDPLLRSRPVRDLFARRGLDVREQLVGFNVALPVLLLAALRLGLHAFIPALLFAPMLWAVTRLRVFGTSRFDRPSARESDRADLAIDEAAEPQEPVRVEVAAEPVRVEVVGESAPDEQVADESGDEQAVERARRP